MADAATTRYALVKPEVGASADTWGGKWNTNLDDLDALTGALATAGSANAYTLTTGLSLASYVDGQTFTVRATFANTGGATMDWDGLGAKNLRKLVAGTLTALASGDISSGDYLRVSYNSASDVIVIHGAALSGVFQPSDATLTALAALAWSSGSPVVQFTAADTVSLTLTPSVTDITTSGQVKIASGTAAAPGLVFSSSTTTGLAYNLSGASSVSVVAATTEAARFGSTRALFLDGSVGSPNGYLNDTDSGWYRIGANNLGLSLGGSKAIDFSTTLIDFSVPARSRVPLSSETSGTLTSASANKKVACSGNITLNDGVFTADDFILFDPGTSARTFTRDTGATMYVNGTDSASATLAANQMGTAHLRTNAVFVLAGAFS